MEQREVIYKLENLIKKVREEKKYNILNLKLEEKIYRSLNLKELESNIETIENIYPKYNTSLFDDIDNKGNVILERILFNLRLRYHSKIFLFIDENNYNPLNNPLFISLQNQYFLVTVIEKNIRNIFMSLLKAHIKESNGMSEDYLINIKDMEERLRFKYNDKFNSSYYKTGIMYLKNNLGAYQTLDFYYNYLDSLIKRIIDKILSFNDEELMDDKIYYKAIVYQTLLRSIFIIIDSYEALIPYEEYYNSKEENDTIAKSIVKTSFISNYDDLNNYKKERKMVNNYGKKNI